MTQVGVFPFRQPSLRSWNLSAVRGAYSFWVGAYASAVHARWIDSDGKTRINALGIASEPEIFWAGRGADELIQQAAMPEAAGSLESAGPTLNGPSGRALDELYLKHLGIARADAWLSDLVPHSCMNEGQARAIDRAYNLLMRDLALPEVIWPRAPKSATDWHILVDRHGRDQIASEVAEASPEILVTLGDPPLRCFAQFFGTRSRLTEYGKSRHGYGRLHEATIGGCRLLLLPFTHPRQAASLGRSSPTWTALHRDWVENRAPGLLADVPQSDTTRPASAE